MHHPVTVQKPPGNRNIGRRKDPHRAPQRQEDPPFVREHWSEVGKSNQPITGKGGERNLQMSLRYSF